MLEAAFFIELAEISGPANLLTEAPDCWPYGYDNSRHHALPDAVVFATGHDQIRRLIQLCNWHRVPITARGRGTGTTGATVPIQGGLVLSLERMDQILQVDSANRMLRVEPGATNQSVQEAAAAHGFFWPPDPTSAAYCTIGGNLACNSAGPRAVKYGTPRENTLGLRAITGDGTELRTGVCTTKGVVGLDLTRLLIGSEGVLAVITEALLKLTPLQEARRTLRAVYASVEAAAEAVSSIMAQPATPCALEFMDSQAIEMVRNHSEADLPRNAGALLIIEIDGNEACLEQAVNAIHQAANVAGCMDISVAHTDMEVKQLWATRKALSPALRNIMPDKINEDVVVPVSRLPELIRGLERLSQKHGITIVNFGHAGNGNMHVNLLLDKSDAQQVQAADRCLDEVFDLVLLLHGTLSGEHGVGLVKRDFIAREIEPATLKLMHRIKQQFDPNGILNPGKSLPTAIE